MARRCSLYWYEQSKPDKYGRYYWLHMTQKEARETLGTRKFRKLRDAACKAFHARTTKDGVKYAAADRDMAWKLGY